jgi:prepilin-type N-terminal cleavage/methylation domain-containing protein
VTVTPPVAPRSAGFSFMEILVVMGIIAVLVGLSVGIFKIVGKKGPR